MGHVSRESTAIGTRDKPVRQIKEPENLKRKRGRPPKSEEFAAQPKQLERQRDLAATPARSRSSCGRAGARPGGGNGILALHSEGQRPRSHAGENPGTAPRADDKGDAHAGYGLVRTGWLGNQSQYASGCRGLEVIGRNQTPAKARGVHLNATPALNGEDLPLVLMQCGTGRSSPGPAPGFTGWAAWTARRRRCCCARRGFWAQWTGRCAFFSLCGAADARTGGCQAQPKSGREKGPAG